MMFAMFDLCRFQAVYNYLPRNEDELELKEGDVVDVMEKCDDGWFVGKKREPCCYHDSGIEMTSLLEPMRQRVQCTIIY